MGEHDSVGDLYLSSAFPVSAGVSFRGTCLSVDVHFHSRFTLRAKIHLPPSVMWWHLFISQPLDTDNQWQHPSAAIAMAAGRNLLCGLLPVSQSATALKATSFQTNRPLHVKLISFTSFPHITTSHRFLLM